MKNDFDTSHLTGTAKKIADAIVDHIRKEEGREPTGGGCSAFYTPEEWRERHADVSCTGALLILVHDGGDLALRCNFSYEQYDAMEQLAAVLKAHGYWVEQATGWWSAVYPLRTWADAVNADIAASVLADEEYVCPHCGSDEIEIPMWVKQKTGTVMDDYDCDGGPYHIWCPKCTELYEEDLTTRAEFAAKPKG